MRTGRMLAAVLALLAIGFARSAAACDEEQGKSGCSASGQCIGCHVRGYPIVIDHPGSYRLCRDLAVPDADTTAILVTADDVTIDLGGHSISGPTVCDSSGCAPVGRGVGISAEDRSGLTVLDGTIRGMGNTGVMAGRHARVQGVKAIGNGWHGIAVDTVGLLSGNLAAGNGATGITGQEYTSFKDNVAHDNGQNGISAGCACSVIGNLATNNARAGISTGGWTACVNNTAAGNAQVQIGGCDAVAGSNVCNYTTCP